MQHNKHSTTINLLKITTRSKFLKIQLPKTTLLKYKDKQVNLSEARVFILATKCVILQFLSFQYLNLGKVSLL